MGRYRIIFCFLLLFISCKKTYQSTTVTDVKKEDIININKDDEFKKISEIINLFIFMKIEKKDSVIVFNNEVMLFQRSQKTKQEIAERYIQKTSIGNKLGMYPSISNAFNDFDIKFSTKNIGLEDVNLNQTLTKFKFINSSSYNGEISFIENTYQYKKFKIKLRFEKFVTDKNFNLIRLSINKTNL